MYPNSNVSLIDVKLNKEKEIAGNSKKLLIGIEVVSEAKNGRMKQGRFIRTSQQ